MGRTKRPFPQGILRLKTDGRKDCEKKYPIYLEYSWNSTPFRKATGLTCRLADWNGNGNNGRGELRASYGVDYRQRNTYLIKLLAATDERFRTFYERGEHRVLTNVDVKSLLNGDDLVRKDKGKDFIGYVLGCLDYWYSTKSIKVSRYMDGKSAMKLFKEFLICERLGTVNNGASIMLGEVNKEIIAKHIEWRRKVKNNKQTTINHALTHIIKALEEAADNDLIEKSVYGQVKKLRH